MLDRVVDVRAEIGEARFTGGKFQEARELFERLSLASRFSVASFC